jgi:hypothetical protein
MQLLADPDEQVAEQLELVDDHAIRLDAILGAALGAVDKGLERRHAAEHRAVLLLGVVAGVLGKGCQHGAARRRRQLLAQDDGDVAVDRLDLGGKAHPPPPRSASS